MKYLHGNELACIRHARRSLALVRQRLLYPSPRVLDNCVPHFRVAIQCLEQLQELLEGEAHLPFGREALRTEMAGLRGELTQVNALMRNAAAFYDGLAQLLGSSEDDLPSYDVSGLVASAELPRLQIEG